MSFDNLRMRLKTMIPLGIMLLTLLGLLGLSAVTLIRVSQGAADLTVRREAGALALVRATRRVTTVPAAIDAAVLGDVGSPMKEGAKADFKKGPVEALAYLDEGARLLVEHGDEIRGFRARFLELMEQAKDVFKRASELPGVDRGATLKPEDLDGLADVARQSSLVHLMVNGLVNDMTAFNHRLTDENAALAADLQAGSRRALIGLVAAGLIGAALAMALSLYVTVWKIERPLLRLGAKMRDLAGGDLGVDIAEAARGDEIGEMARAVEVFKTNAVERRRAESEATTARQAAEAERARAAEERANAAQAQTSALSALREGLRRLAEGDLGVRLFEGFAENFTDVRDDFNSAADKLKAAMALVVRSTGAIHASSREIGEASNNLSQRTEQQAASLEETAAALGEITNTLRASAENARAAADAVAAADADARQGAVVVRQAVEAMDAIAQSSQKIGQIIGAIDEIAFQTNLLALNAGVEAARAGDSGRGFAVVASEVRALAQRSAEAAKEIKALVSTSGAQVTSGVKLVAASGKALESIIAQVSEINAVVASIAAATQQQASGIAEINTAISHMDQTTQQNATMVEESTAASHSLSKEMSELTRLVEQFRLDAPGAADLRRSLQAAAPHAFARPAAPPRGKTPAGPKLAAAGGEWTEF